MKQSVVKIPWSESVWFFDVDDTLIDTAGLTLSASEGIKKVFASKYPEEDAERVQKNYVDIFTTMMDGYRVKHEDEWKNIKGGKEAYENILKEIESLQKRVKEKYGFIKKWSREVLIKIAADRVGLKATPEMILEAGDAYWISLAEQTQVYPQALALVKEIKKHNRPIYLITSSDGRLTLAQDGQFDYEPKYSEALKRQRIDMLRDKGVEFSSLSIGDPEDKPHQDFFEKGMRAAEEDLGKPFELSNTIMLGDSFGGDLKTPKEVLGFGLVVLFEKGSNDTKIVDEHQINTGNLQEVAKFLV